MTDITLFEFTPTRSARVRWTLLEAGIDFESIDLNDSSVFGNPELLPVSPSTRQDALVITMNYTICSAMLID